MVIIFVNSEHHKTSNPHRLFLNLTDKSDLRGEKSEKCCVIKSLYLLSVEKYKRLL